jgi:hypothetical protein
MKQKKFISDPNRSLTLEWKPDRGDILTLWQHDENLSPSVNIIKIRKDEVEALYRFLIENIEVLVEE